MPIGLYFPGYSEQVANPDMGDSAIAETIGRGGFAMVASPAVAGFVGAGSASEAAGYTNAMQPGVGQAGAGIVRAPMACFEQGLVGLAECMGVS